MSFIYSQLQLGVELLVFATWQGLYVIEIS